MLTDTGRYVTALRRGVANCAAGPLTERLRAAATAHGWDPEVVAQLAVHADGLRLVVTGPDGAEDFEYGSPEHVPTGVIRALGMATDWHKDLIDAVLAEVG